jgi:guanosine-3',5'-bis(diphosphate) 3'-pyrophosphohydrolase
LLNYLLTHTKLNRQAENFRKMIVAMSRDIRVILVKLADRTHNIRTLKFVAPHKQREVAHETLDLYAPLAHRLGIFWLKTELEDTSLRYLEPKVYEDLKHMVSTKKEEREAYAKEVTELLLAKVRGVGLESARVTGRAKHFYSIYQKMRSRGLTHVSEVHDLIAFRILVDDITACYQALGVVHTMWKPVPGRFKDYIALAKPNMYQSLHTTVIGPGGQRIEVQIRTDEMHQVAEEGIAAHWMYKGENKGVEEARRFAWLRQLVEWVQQLNDPEEFLHTVKEDLFEKEVFVFSPKVCVRTACVANVLLMCC